MRILGSTLASIAFIGVLLAGETRREAWPDGTPRAEYEVEQRAGGKEVRSGPSRSWHANGQLESQGTYADDRQTGRWKFFHPDGARAAEGSFARGQRTGVWETFHASGARASKGRYEKGARSGAWSFWNEEESVDALQSGHYEAIALRLADGRALTGERLDGAPHGDWMSTWPDGAPMLVGRLARGRREGDWRFHLPDGTVSALLSGRYEDDRRVAPLAPEEGAAPGAWPELEPASLGWPAARKEIELQLESWLAADAKKLDELRRELERRQLEPSWIAAGPGALPVVLRRLLACDPASAAGRDEILRLDQRVLGPLCAGHRLAELEGALEGALAGAEDAREYQRAWAGLWAATRDDAWFWCVELALTPPATAEQLLVDRPFARMLAALDEQRARPALYAARFEPRDERAEAPLAAALAWLERNQLSDGHWSASMDTTKPMAALHDAGITGLAVLALLGAGRTPQDSAAASAGVAWLLRHQDPTSGEIPGQRRSHDWFYDHVLATLALCESHALAPSPILASRAQKAVDLVLAARNEESAWGYDLPPLGESDTSISAWAATALLVAREASLEGDFAAAFEGARRWIDGITEPSNGRIGYNVRGSLSSRTPANEEFPRETGEAMTAAGLFVRRLLGVSLEDPLLEKQLDLLAAKPPLWDPEGLGVDEYYFYYGAQAMALCGALQSGSWKAGLSEIARAQNGNEAERGSWDPVGAWAFCGGRVYSTALLALALEAPFRYTLPDLDAKDRKGKPRKK